MIKYVRLEDAIHRSGIPSELLDELLADELIVARQTLERDRVIPAEQEEDLRVATTLVRELGVNVAGVEVILHMRRHQLALLRELDETMVEVKDELRRRLRDPRVLGPAALFPLLD